MSIINKEKPYWARENELKQALSPYGEIPLWSTEKNEPDESQILNQTAVDTTIFDDVQEHWLTLNKVDLSHHLR